MKKTTQSGNDTSFHNDTFHASVADIIQICGEPAWEDNSGDDKVNFEWTMETDSGDAFTIYDWKEYRSLEQNEIVEWHIGGHSSNVTEQALNEIATELNDLH